MLAGITLKKKPHVATETGMGASWGWWLWLLMVAYCYSIVMRRVTLSYLVLGQ